MLDHLSSKDLVTHYACADITVGYHIYVSTKAPIKESKYVHVTPQRLAHNSAHLQLDQQVSLMKILRQLPHLFSGELGRYNKSKFSLERQDPTVQPIFCKPYPVA